MDNYAILLRDLIGSGGKMEKNIDSFVYRDEQLQMSYAVMQALENDNFLVAEAGTGVGKTFAYLIPAVIWASQEKDKVVISTKTKALQEQIVGHDLPQLARIMGNKFRYTEAKGRENFLCWHKYMSILSGRKSLNDNEQLFIQSILSWAEQTRTGDRKELALNSELMKNWHLVAADRNSCQKEMCKYHDKCFRLKMIRSLEKSDIIISNHALLLSDVMTEHSILPEYEHLIIDEAHTFVKESFDKLARSFSVFDTLDVLKVLYMKDRHSSRGYLIHLRSTYPHLADNLGELSTMVDREIILSNQIFDRMSTAFKYPDSYNFNRILSSADMEKSWFTETIDIYLEWQANINLIIKKLDLIREEIENEEELPGLINRLQEISDSAFCILEEDMYSQDIISWLDYDKGRVIAISSSAIQMGEILAQRLYEKLRTLVMVSATLTIEDKFDHFIARNGLGSYLDENRLDTILQYSPFNYDKQACLCVLQDMPDPGSQKFDAELPAVIADIISTVGGQTLVLFTSRKQLHDVSAKLRPYCQAENLRLLVQYEDGEFRALMDEFKKNSNTVLMGVETFWEGIDLKGDILKCLVIVKLPFRPPSDPFCSAWEKYYKTQGKNSFSHFMLPDAAVRFKQGTGRLIRSESDHGVVVVLDTRLLKKNYGKVFRNSIPIKNFKVCTKKTIRSELQEWI